MDGLIDSPVHTQTLQFSKREALLSGAGEELLNFHLKDPQLKLTTGLEESGLSPFAGFVWLLMCDHDLSHPGPCPQVSQAHRGICVYLEDIGLGL